MEPVPAAALREQPLAKEPRFGPQRIIKSFQQLAAPVQEQLVQGRSVGGRRGQLTRDSGQVRFIGAGLKCEGVPGLHQRGAGRLPHAEEGHAQVGPRLRLILIAVEQPGQTAALHRLPRHRQVNEQRPARDALGF